MFMALLTKQESYLEHENNNIGRFLFAHTANNQHTDKETLCLLLKI